MNLCILSLTEASRFSLNMDAESCGSTAMDVLGVEPDTDEPNDLSSLESNEKHDAAVKGIKQPRACLSDHMTGVTDDTGNQCSKRARTRTYTPWSDEEEAVLFTYFSECVKKEICPGKAHVAKFVKLHPEFAHRRWDIITAKIFNKIQKNKRLLR